MSCFGALPYALPRGWQLFLRAAGDDELVVIARPDADRAVVRLAQRVLELIAAPMTIEASR